MNGDPPREALAEDLWELEQVLLEPGCFGDCSVADAAATLASELVGGWRDDEITGRLEKLVAEEAAGNLRGAHRHLTFVRRKLQSRFGVTLAPSRPADSAAALEYPAWRRQKPRSASRKSAKQPRNDRGLVPTTGRGT